MKAGATANNNAPAYAGGAADDQRPGSSPVASTNSAAFSGAIRISIGPYEVPVSASSDMMRGA